MGCGASSVSPAADDTAELRSLFDTIDADGNSSITKKELQAKLAQDETVQELLVKAGGSADYVMEQLDVDGDGIITWKEFEAMLSVDASKLAETIAPGSAPPVPPPPRKEETSMDRLRKLFDTIDTSGDGKVSRSELQAHMRKSDEVVKLLFANGGSVDYVFDQLNGNDDDAITWDEFSSMLTPDARKFVRGSVGVDGASDSAPAPAVGNASPTRAAAEEPVTEEDEMDALLAETALME